MSIHEHLLQILFVELRCLQHSEQAAEGSQEPHHDGVRGVEDCHQDESELKTTFNQVDGLNCAGLGLHVCAYYYIILKIIRH